MGRFEASVPIRRHMFEKDPSVFYLQQWLEHLPEGDRSDAVERARQVALDHAEAATAASLLIELGDVEAAEARLIADADRLRGEHFSDLELLAKALRTHGRWRGETVIHRALLFGILERGYARAYRHGARYWARLAEIAESGADLAPLGSHENFAAEVRLRHGRKPAFWAQVNARRGGAADVEDSRDEGFEF
jgi:hypothetical protein